MPTNVERLPQPDESKGILVDVEKAKEPELPPGLEGWMERIEKGEDEQTVIRDRGGQVVMQSASPGLTTLPVTKSGWAKGFTQGVSDVGRWLSNFVFRLIKIKKGKVKFKQDDNN